MANFIALRGHAQIGFAPDFLLSEKWGKEEWIRTNSEGQHSDKGGEDKEYRNWKFTKKVGPATSVP